ncbi:ROK family protein [Jatrophihabitans sp. YIM 134969]
MTQARPRLPAVSPAAIDVFTHLLTSGPAPRVAIAQATGLSQAAVTKAVAPLVTAGFVTFHDVDTPRPAAGAGRPPVPVRVVTDAALAVGVKVTREEVVGVVTDLGASVLVRHRRGLRRHTVGEVSRTVTAVVARLRGDLGAADDRVIGVGVTVSGDVDTAAGVVRHSPLLGWRDVALGDAVAAATGLPVRIDNDVRALTIAERWFGVGRGGADPFVIVTIGSGIGCGIYVNGDVVSGAFGVAGEIGHLPIAGHGRPCTCGRTGCLETVASTDAVLADVETATGRTGLTLADAVDLAHAGNPAAVEAFDRAASAIGTAIATVVNLIGPRVVVIEGEAVSDFDLYDRRLREAFAAGAFGAAGRCDLQLRAHTFEAWARGAAASVIRAFVRQGRRPAT